MPSEFVVEFEHVFEHVFDRNKLKEIENLKFGVNAEEKTTYSRLEKYGL